MIQESVGDEIKWQFSPRELYEWADAGRDLFIRVRGARVVNIKTCKLIGPVLDARSIVEWPGIPVQDFGSVS